ncbi:TreTu family toxin [Chitiniphilus eburneus]|uniref:TreTu family toxin n=1 Tax=Chitiniphilus eburneus TaxID=2571148 RepID=UPI00402B67D3
MHGRADYWRAEGSRGRPGSLYVEFSVPTSSLGPTNQGWANIVGRNAAEGRLMAKKGGCSADAERDRYSVCCNESEVIHGFE